MYEGIDKRSPVNPNDKREAILEWRIIDYSNYGGKSDLPTKIIIECNGKDHRKVVINEESNSSELLGEPWPCDQAEHNPLLNKL